jgi:hypothetical protein
MSAYDPKRTWRNIFDIMETYGARAVNAMSKINLDRYFERNFKVYRAERLLLSGQDITRRRNVVHGPQSSLRTTPAD